MIFTLQSIAQLGGAHMINGMVEGLAVAFFASAFLWAISCRNSGTRFAVWFSTLLAVIALSLLALVPAHNETIATRLPHWTLPAAWATYMFIAWAMIAGVGLLRVAIAIRHVVQLKRDSAAIAELAPQAEQRLADFDSSRLIQVRVSDQLRVPTAIGFFKPAILLPRWIIEDLSPEELKAVVLHELGHLHRWDDWTNLAQKIARAVFFFHPGVWWIDSRLTLEREMACDDLVLARIGNARGYAECLVSVAEKSAVRSKLALALAAVSRMKQTALRITRILDRRRTVETRMSRAAVSVMAVVSGFALLALPRTPALIAFQTNLTPAQVAQSSEAHERSTEFKSFGLIPARSTTALLPRVIEAKMTYRSSNHVANKNRSTAYRSSVNRAALKRTRVASPAITRAALTDAEALSPAPVLLVVQTEEYSDNISHFWTVCVWRIDAPSKSSDKKPVQVRNGTVSKAI